MNCKLSNFELATFTMISLLLVVIVIVSPVSSSAQTIEAYQQLAAENNPAVRAEFQKYLASLEEEPQVSALPDPEVAFAYFISPIETRLGPQQARISIDSDVSMVWQLIG